MTQEMETAEKRLSRVLTIFRSRRSILLKTRSLLLPDSLRRSNIASTVSIRSSKSGEAQIDQVQEDRGVLQLFEGGDEGAQEHLREVLDEAHRVGQDDLLAARILDEPRGGGEGAEERSWTSTLLLVRRLSRVDLPELV